MLLLTMLYENITIVSIMIDRIILQVPMPKALKEEAEAVAKDYGFSSLQETIRLLLRKLSKRELGIEVREQVIKLSPKAEARYMEMEKDFRSGKNIYKAKDLDEFVKQLHEA